MDLCTVTGSLPMLSGGTPEQQKKRRAAVVAAASNGDADGAARKAVMNVVQVWLDRLQLVSVIVSTCVRRW
jgi:hypothetical protein